ncbi:MAG: hypothetical protein ABW092_09235 [Candidatus Thiodiazotropha sp.]
MMIVLFLIMVLIPSVSCAEVSDKMPSISEIFFQGIFISVGVFMAGWFRWWLGVLFLPLLFLFVAGTVLLWNVVPMRQALLNEQGWKYFGALALNDSLIGIAIIAGAIIGFKRQSVS